MHTPRTSSVSILSQRWFMGCLFAGLFLSLTACGPRVKDTRLTHQDTYELTSRMAESLSKSAWLRERDTSSKPVYISINKVRNLSSDRISISEQWAIVSAVRAKLPLNEWANKKNVYFLITPERRQTARDGGYHGDFGPGEEADLLISAEFISARRTSRDEDGFVQGMLDQYLMAFHLTSLDEREILWSDRFEVKREATGLLID